MAKFRIQDPEVIDEAVIHETLHSNDEVIVQFSKPKYTEKILAQLDKLAAANDAKFTLRFYDNRASVIDCNLFDYIPNVKSLWIDCTGKVKNIEKLKQLKFLEKIGIGIFELEDLDILNYDSLKKLINFPF